MSAKKKDDKEIIFEKDTGSDFLWDLDDDLKGTERLSPQEKKEYLEFLWRKRFFSC